MQNKNIKFGIILPTINRASLHNAIDSVVNQEYKDWTLHIVQHGIYASDMLVQVWPDNRLLWHHIDKHGNDSGTLARKFQLDMLFR